MINHPEAKINKLNRQLAGYPVVVGPCYEQSGGKWKLLGYEAANLGNKRITFNVNLNQLMDAVNNMIDNNHIMLRPYA
jgi:hypothetical protein